MGKARLGPNQWADKHGYPAIRTVCQSRRFKNFTQIPSHVTSEYRIQLSCRRRYHSACTAMSPGCRIANDPCRSACLPNKPGPYQGATMKTLPFTATILAGIGAALATPAAAQTDSYRVEANSEQTINLNICNPEVFISVNGDGDTDLDFVIRNSRGDIVHSDYDLTDVTFTTLYRRNGVQCENFQLEVSNLGQVWNRYEVVMQTVATDARSGSADDWNREVSLVNDTKETIFYLYWSNTGASGWGDDKLGSDILSAGQQWNVTVDDGSGACRYDFKAVTASGREIERRNVNVCGVFNITFN